MAPKYVRGVCGACGQPVERISGAFARKQREAAGVSVREMARRLGLSAPYISDLELDRRNISLALWDRYTEALVAKDSQGIKLQRPGRK